MVANERGQLLLIGGVAIAIVVFSTILFAHSLAVTDGITTTGSADTIERSADREASVERDLGVLAIKARGDNLDGFEGRYEHALQNYTRTHNRVVASSGGTYLNATLNKSASLGTEVNQTSDEKITNQTGAEKDWTVVSDADRIVGFNFTFTEANDDGSPSPFNITVKGANSNWWALEVYRNGTGPIKNKTIKVKNNTSPGGNSVCSAENSGVDLEVDLVAGTCNDGSGFKTFSDVTEPPYEISVTKGQKAKGTYRLVAIGNFPDSNYKSTNIGQYPIIPAVDTTYDTPSASYNRTVLVEVDDG
ncbi:hypothetical protein [Haloarcula sp. Atlit-7R]|uniref:hypothetical protein n=1 Tax=Haloarcula sp. Atlit-7R TaxID=2282125 RepID=UPI000EF1550F|nr:hypothetical protein [Haloarcula sp. Atlit-7R]RLM89450.1 hypothetical protein D3D01_19690 [Haloarcula sp. Atlit-7R]